MTPALYVGLFVASLLVGGNIFFIKKLVDKVGETESNSVAARTQITLLQKDIEILQSRISELNTSLREITDLKSKITILEFKYEELHRRHPASN